MTMFDEETLRNALAQAANEFSVSTTAPDRILEQARSARIKTKPGRAETLYLRIGRTKSIVGSLAASILVVAVAVPLFLSEQPGATSPTYNPVASGSPKKIGVHGEAVPPATSSTSSASQGRVTVTGSGFLLGARAPKAAQTSTSGRSSGSLRIEEVGTIDLNVGGGLFQTALAQLTGFARADGGFVSSTHAHTGTKKDGTFTSGSIVLQVPQRRFATLVDQVRRVGHETSVVTSANDVTSQYVDLQARISALGVSRSQYLKIMTRTNSINGILAVQSQLNSIQSQIEQLKGQLNLLNSETTYATLSVVLVQSGATPSGVPNGFDKAWHDSVTGFVSGFEWLLRIAGPLLFALILVTFLAAMARLAWRTTQRRRS